MERRTTLGNRGGGPDCVKVRVFPHGLKPGPFKTATLSSSEVAALSSGANTGNAATVDSLHVSRWAQPETSFRSRRGFGAPAGARPQAGRADRPRGRVYAETRRLAVA